MSKLRNFFLAVFGFFILAVAFYVFTESVWVRHQASPAILAAPADEYQVLSPTPKKDPDWLISSDQIDFYCNHPWVIRKRLPVLKHTINELINLGLSECYAKTGAQAIYSHLWVQGIGDGDWYEAPPKSPEQIIIGKNIELFFDYDARFEDLNLVPPITVSLSGNVVHDLNGDAIFNLGEPTIPETPICILRDPLSPLCVRSSSEGEYRFDNILPGAWRFRLYSPTGERLTEFKYTNYLLEANYLIPETIINGYTITKRFLNLTEFNPIEKEILLLVDQQMEHDFFLMQEWATYFAAPKDFELFLTEAYYDFDVRKGITRIYNGEGGPTYDQHDGLDASCPRGTEIVSVAEGRVIAILYESTVVIQHTNQLISVYGHGDPLVKENQFVPRGYPVALCNNQLTASAPHLHFAIWENSPWLNRVSYGIPPYADLVNSEEKWVANPDPLDKNYFVYLLQGGRGVWTDINQPHLPFVKLLKD
jgi:murein DD-endopeptidase MepM/ murein hydrolase activator NlpD